MIFAELDYPQRYEEFHSELMAFLQSYFQLSDAGLQGDSWIEIRDGDHRVLVDTFSSMKHQVKAKAPSVLLDRVISVLRTRYVVLEFRSPILDGSEGW